MTAIGVGARIARAAAQTIATLRGVDPAIVKAELADAGITPANIDVVRADAADLPEFHVDLSDLDEDGAG